MIFIEQKQGGDREGRKQVRNERWFLLLLLLLLLLIQAEGWAGHTVAESAGFCSPAASCWSSGHVTREKKPSAVSVQCGMGEV